jgi:MFS family permease
VLNPLNSSLIAVALIQLAEDFELSFASVSWMISLFYLTSAVAQPVSGRLGDVLGPRRLFLAGLALVGLASAAAPLAPNFGILLAIRAVQALGSSAIYPSGMAIIRRVVVEGRARALAVVSVFSSVVAAVGPSLGGYLVAWQGWEATFLASLPLVAVAMVLGVVVLPADPPSAAESTLRRIDLLGIVLFSATLVGTLLFLLSLEGEPAWWALALGTAGAALFLRVETRVAEPFIDLRALRSTPGLAGIYLQYAMVNLVFYAVFFGVPSFLQVAKGLAADEAGLVMLAVAGSGVVSTPVAARLIERVGVRSVLIIGAVFLTAGALGLQLITAQLSNAATAALLAVIGVSVGFTNLGLQSALYDTVPSGNVGAAAGLFQTSRYLGTILSASLLGVLFGDEIDTASLHQLGWCLAAVSALVLVLDLRAPGGRRAGSSP